MMDATSLVESVLPAYDELKSAIKTNDLICITGPPSVGKTTLVKLLFEENPKILSAFVSCYDVTTSVQLYSKVCSKFHAAMNICKKDKAGKLIGQYRVDQNVNEPDFPQYCEEYCNYAERCDVEKLFVVVDQFELAKGSQLIDSIALLMTIQKLGIIIVTNKSPTNVVDYLSHCSPRIGLIAQDRMIPIFVKNWSKSDIIQTILDDKPKRDEALYKKFVQNVVNILYLESTQNFYEIKIYCRENFQDFLNYFKEKTKNLLGSESESEESDECHFGNHRQLSSLTSSFLESFKQLIKKKDMNSWRSEGVQSKLTHNSAFLMIAAYVAAHTSPTDDKRNFGTSSRSKVRRVTRNDESTESSRSFTLERLIQLYRAITRLLNEKHELICNNDTILLDIERFESLGILQIAGGDGFSSDTRYRLSTCIRREDILNIAEVFQYSKEIKSNLGMCD